jgi:hypothetical protein
MVMSRARALTNEKWITVTKHSWQPWSSISHSPQEINLYAPLANPAPTPTLQCQLACPVLDQETGKTLKHLQLRKDPKYKTTWNRSYANELGRLCQGIGSAPSTPTPPTLGSRPALPNPPKLQRVKGTNTMRPIMFQKIPKDQISNVAHTRVVCMERPTKANLKRTCITIGGNTIEYFGDTGTKTGSI